MSDSDADGHEDGDDGEQGQQSVERRVGTMTTVTSDVPRIDRNVSQTVAHTRQVRLILSHAYNTKVTVKVRDKVNVIGTSPRL